MPPEPMLHRRRSRFLTGLLATVGAMAGHLLLAQLGLWIPNLGVIFITAVAYSTYVGGPWCGLLSAALTLVYATCDWQLVHHSPENRMRLVVLYAATPLMVLMVGVWKRRFDAASRAALRETEERFRLLAEGLKDSAFFQLDPGGRVTGWNPRAGHLTGYREEEILGRPVSALYPPADVEGGKPGRDLARAAAEGHIEEEGWRRRRDGSRIWAQTILSAMRDDEGRLRGFACITRDLSERRRTEEELRASEERLRTVIGKSPVVLYAMDREGVFTLSEGKGLEALGLRPGEVVGRSVFDVYRDAPEVLASVRRALSGEAFSSVVTVGDLTWDSHYTPLRDPSGASSGVIGVATNITERRRAEEALRRTQERLRSVIGM